MPKRPLSTAEFVALVAFSFSLVAMSIDAMLPALGKVASDLGANGANDRQLVLTTFFGGMTVGQIVYGPLADSMGRKRAMFAGAVILSIGTLLCALATSFPMMLVGRVVAGVGAAGARIVPLAVVRDLHAGREMARIMSIVTTVFILVPIVAPTVGQAILALGSWRAIFVLLLVMNVLAWAWFALRLPETLDPKNRRALSVGPITRALLEVVRNRQTLAYTIAAGLVFGSLLAYLGTAQQIFGEQYRLGSSFPLYFAALAAALGVASLVNARLVGRFGMQVLARAALSVSSLASAGFFALAIVTRGQPRLAAFMAYMLVVFFCNGLLFGNFNALAMEPMGHIAGSAASVIGSLTSLVSVLVGTPIGRAYDGTVIPLVSGLFGLTALALLVTVTLAPKPTQATAGG